MLNFNGALSSCVLHKNATPSSDSLYLSWHGILDGWSAVREGELLCDPCLLLDGLAGGLACLTGWGACGTGRHVVSPAGNMLNIGSTANDARLYGKKVLALNCDIALDIGVWNSAASLL